MLDGDVSHVRTRMTSIMCHAQLQVGEFLRPQRVGCMSGHDIFPEEAEVDARRRITERSSVFQEIDVGSVEQETIQLRICD